MKPSSRGFTRQMLSIAVPVALQNLLFSSFTLIDTVMIGALGDLPLAAVGMAGKWTFFSTVVFFGLSSGASVFMSQYFGAGDTRGIHRTYGVLCIGELLVAAVFMLLGLLMPQRIIGFFTNDPAAMELGAKYLRIIALSYPFSALFKCGSTLLQSTQRVVIPFIGAACSVAVNVVFNALLIFGLLGFPALGVQGAAIASLMAAAVNAAVVYGLGLSRDTLLRAKLRDMLSFTPKFILDFLCIGAPVMLNETIWAAGNLAYSSIFGHMSTGAYAAITVVKSIEDLTSVAFMGMYSSCAVMIGSMIGRGDIQAARDCARRHLYLIVASSLLVGGAVIALRGPILSLFGVSDAVRADAKAVLLIYALEMVLRNIPAMLVMGIFRAGGDTRFGLIIDGISLVVFGIPATAIAGLVLGFSVPSTYLVMYLFEDIFKVIVYGTHMARGKWIKPVTGV